MIDIPQRNADCGYAAEIPYPSINPLYAFDMNTLLIYECMETPYQNIGNIQVILKCTHRGGNAKVLTMIEIVSTAAL